MSKQLSILFQIEESRSSTIARDDDWGILGGVCRTPGCENLKLRRQGVRYCESCRSEKTKAVAQSKTIKTPKWGCEEDALLGTQTDPDIAKLIGRTAGAVCARRLSLGIPKYEYPLRSVPVRRGSKGRYLMRRMPKDSPLRDMARGDGYVLEHRFVMAQHLGRPLTLDEFVHHRNGNSDDNRLENLELWTRSHPDGQRVDDVLEWCVEFIERYAQEVDDGRDLEG